MAQMWHPPEEDDPPHRGNEHPGLRKSYHMELADQLDAQAGGSAFPAFMRSTKGALITLAVVVLLMTIFGWYGGLFL
ncbi:MAG: hypothetical protein WA962_04770 [Ornithinimicrobium sp.]